MSVVSGIEGAASTGVARLRPATPGAGFAVPSDAAASGTRAPAEPRETVALSGLLALQEADPGAETEPARDRAARRRGREILAALAEVQRALLGTGDARAELVRLAELALDPPVAADPGLGAIIAAIRLRARLELARQSAN